MLPMALPRAREDVLARSLGVSGASWAVLAASSGPLGSSWGRLGAEKVMRQAAGVTPGTPGLRREAPADFAVWALVP